MPPRRTIAAGRFLHLVEEGGWEFAERRNASGVVAVVAITPDGCLVLTRQRRIAVGAEVIDLPAGLAGDDTGAADERLEQAARRELVEETGWDAERFEHLTAGPPSPGLSSEIVALYRAHGLRQVGAGGGVAGEGITVCTPPLAGITGWLSAQEAGGALIDLKVWAALHFAGVRDG